ncbi:hypothetical protein HFP15_25070 [Amycolatopsis sp. K13G38]|uniref:ChsH2 C-terminal OB-fold domain-containing protein n=1 Tax=Amycolatopsis acididurans TaxID=2724524 RepID=A0ABX1JCP3_9PSEU|nr:OB-fold domain-containing protein [Amycolatopsis acididurans]NKQ56155.1 hypothetical protein [Amycolatopsis acididurans]
MFGRDDVLCLRCGSDALADIGLGDRGTLWAFTVLRNPPPGDRRAAAISRVPQPLGLVELDGMAVRVMARIDVDVDRLEIGLPLRLAGSELYVDGGAPVVGYSFEEA